MTKRSCKITSPPENPTCIKEVVKLYHSLMKEDELVAWNGFACFWTKAIEIQKNYWPDLPYRTALVTSCLYLINARYHNQEVCIEDLSYFLSIPRTSMVRKLKIWEGNGMITLVNDGKIGKRTRIYGTKKAEKKLHRYFQDIKNLKRQKNFFKIKDMNDSWARYAPTQNCSSHNSY
tara:strand:+ start:2301 stop:2828 length:528 start_codon:yes stop_codon:yes gene_type:complete